MSDIGIKNPAVNQLRSQDEISRILTPQKQTMVCSFLPNLAQCEQKVCKKQFLLMRR